MKDIFYNYYFKFSNLAEKQSINVMRLSISFVYIWFGVLKIIGLSPAEDLVKETVFWFNPEFFIPILGVFEVLLGFGLLVKKLIPYTIAFLLLHMAVTFVPMIILNDECFKKFPYEPTLTGQYIIKNFVLISGILILAAKYNRTYFLNNRF
jgi:uncharacterized membrane protein YkgB